MKYGSYQRYKNPGAERLGNIPDQWEIIRAKYLMHEINEPTVTGEETLLSVSEYTGVRPRVESMEKGDHLTRADSLEGYKRCKANDLVMNIMLAWKRGQGVAPIDGIISPAYAVYRMKSPLVDSRYIHYLARSDEYVNLFGAWSYGVIPSRWRLYPEVFLRLPIILPSIKEQRTIAAFLDRETSRIDQLITKKERQIKLLQEKRSALISHAVTTGLNPKARIKDSGIEWLGEIPEHWEVRRLKYLTHQLTVGIVVTPAKYYVDEGIPCLRSLNVREDQLLDTDLVYISEDSNELHAKSKLNKGDLVAVRTGQPGTTAVIDQRYNGANCIDLIIVRRSSLFDSRYLCYVMNSEFAKTQFSAGSSGAIQAHFNIETAANLLIPVPPIEEQRRTREKLDVEVNRIIALMGRITNSIGKLQEYRTALISAAVTGKLDVREEVA
jgi:type I restriction enzyme S subunit